ncbi:MAG: acyl carrier protein [Thermodesulfobacteria bacterium]|nr:acyl carrier protein [Thermodesulfobacteriota bacterium]
MNRDEILRDVEKLLREVLSTQAEIKPETRLEADLAIDSLRAMELLAAVEDHFDISIPINVLNEVQTVEDLVDQIQKLLAEG